MGRKGTWFSSVKKVFISDPKKDQKLKPSKSKLGCFGHHGDHDMESEGSSVDVVPALPPLKQIKPVQEDNEQNKQAFSMVLATAVAAGAAVAAAAAEVARMKSIPPADPVKTKEMAAIKIQTAFRGYLAKRSLRGLRGLARLRALIKGQSVKRQAATTLHCMQTLSRLQSQVHARRIRMSEENQALQRQLQQKREKELEQLQTTQVGGEWDASKQSKAQLEAKLLHKQTAAMRREKALAYASSRQQSWRSPSKPTNDTSMDPNNPHWGWNWLERWMASRPWEGQNNTQNNDNANAKNATNQTMSVGEITKLYTSRDQSNQESKKNPSASQKAIRLGSQSSLSLSSFKALSLTPPRENSNKAKTSSTPRVVNRRHSIATSEMRDHSEILPNSPHVISRHTSFTKGAKGKLISKVQIPSSNAHSRNQATEKKRLSSSSVSPTRSSRWKLGMVSNNKNSITTIPEEKVKARTNGGSR